MNFFDSAAGIRLFNNLKKAQIKIRFVRIVNIRLYYISNTAMIDFITELFLDKTISYSLENKVFLIKADYNVIIKDDTKDLLDKCKLLNTYLGSYFVPMRIIDS